MFAFPATVSPEAISPALQAAAGGIGLTHYLVLAAVLFTIGFIGVTTSRNLIRVLMSLELMLNAVNINMVAFHQFLSPAQGADFQLPGQVFAIFILTVSAAEAAVGLAIAIALYRQRSTIEVGSFRLLHD